MSKKTTPNSSTPAVSGNWVILLFAALYPHRGETLALPELYAAVEKHPDFKEVSRYNKNPRARIRATCQWLRDRQRLEWKGKGLWRVPEDLVRP